MKILGLDHGARTGWGVLDDGNFVDCGFYHITCCDVAHAPGRAIGFRLAKMNDNVTELINKWRI
jgi:hypothetical protein